MSALLIRADASTAIGTGHVMRCLALAQCWQDLGGTACLAAAEIPEPLRQRLIVERIPIHRVEEQPGSQEDAEKLAATARRIQCSAVVVDGYHFRSEFQKTLKDAGLRVLGLDDCGIDGPIYADAILNQNIQADESLYPQRRPDIALLLGTRYALLRREFLAKRTPVKSPPETARNLLVTMGGSDPDNITTRFLTALAAEELRGFDIRVAVGGGNLHRPAIQAAIRAGKLRAEILADVRDMPSLMTWADLAVSAGGSTCWELAFLGVPAVLLGLADNQRPAIETLHRQGVFLGFPHADTEPLGPVAQAVAALAADPIRRAEMSRRGRELVDGQGASRVCAHLKGTGR